MTQALIERARTNLNVFTQATKPDYQSKWFHDIICDHLERVRTREIKKLMIFMPPRHGKSELVSRRFPAYLLGRNPDTQIITCSHSHGLASRLNRDVQRIITDEGYSLVFPDTKLSAKNTRTLATEGSWLRNNEIFEVVGCRGFYKCAGVGGGITGFGFTDGIIDDPFKNEAEASSVTVRDSVWEWYTSTFLTRAEKDAAIVLCQTRWHVDDLAGRLLEKEPGEWTVISFPAIANEIKYVYDIRNTGEALWPEKYPVEKLAKTKAVLPISQWNALYQQSPTVKGGDTFKPREWVKSDNYVRAIPAGSKTAWYWDNAGTQGGGANTAGTLGAFHEGKFYIIYSVARQLSAANREALKRERAEWAKARYGTVTIYNEQEPGSGGKEQFENTTRTLAGFAVKADKVTGSKESRAFVLASQMEVGNIFIVVPDGADNGWVSELFDELEQFPKGKRKDRVDSLSGCYNCLALQKHGATVTYL